ncbi:MAG: SIS domain-containing protein [Cyclobacteriaceae bacterium]|nr:SIS domain-containing protein [Cyclobacteriaceae bacterium]
MNNSGQTNYLDNDTKFKYNTAFEISNQPYLWRQTWQCIRNRENELRNFLDALYKKKDLVIILTGAGSSAFIGVALQGPFQKNTHMLTRAISTTDLVTHPDLFLQKERPTLLISFARSGDSPESIAAVNLLNELCTEAYHLIITCNARGKLAQEKNKENNLVFLLPPETNDKGLAMTASFTSMLLSGILISKIHHKDDLDSQVVSLASYGTNILENYSEKLKAISRKDFKRVVFLGSGPLLGTARESHLKLQELTDGKIICKHDSFLGFRHGPKAVIDKSTIVIYLFSNKKYPEQYERDLVSELCEQAQGMYSIGVSERLSERNYCLDLDIVMDERQESVDEEFLSVCHVLPAQILGYYKSLELGLNPDNPSESGVISRVVQGVKIYSY